MTQRLILVGKHAAIEPLGIVYLLGLAKRLGWETRVVLVHESDFAPLYDEVAAFSPTLVGFSVWTGYHANAFAAADRLREAGVGVVIGGPHATYFTSECARHADWVVKGEGFRMFRRLLEGDLPRGVHFDEERVAEGFPMPDRDTLYERYELFAKSPIKSIFCSVGCPFQCSYCYAPSYNSMYGGFALNVRPVDEICDEALAIKRRWPLELVYFQDDVFGFNIPWLREFAEKWPARVGVPWHCQIRLELTREMERLELFRAAGCTGITLAIESGNDFLRRYVLLRPMPDELIVEGVRRVQSQGFSLRTQQILAVPFSDLATDLETLELNVRLKPDLAWTSILAPYGGTDMGTIANGLGFYAGNNDDLSETFFSRSVLRHAVDARVALEPVVRAMSKGKHDNPLLKMETRNDADGRGAGVFVRDEAFGRVLPGTKPVARFTWLDPADNARYCDQTVALQRVFAWLAQVPAGHVLGARFVALEPHEWTWGTLGALTAEHLVAHGYGDRMAAWREALVTGMDPVSEAVVRNPWFFCFVPSGAEFARHLASRRVFDAPTDAERFDRVGYELRQWMYDRALYKLAPALAPIASSVAV